MGRLTVELDELERAVLKELVAGDPSASMLQQQLVSCSVRGRESTGVGFFTSLDVDRRSAAPVAGLPRALGGVHADIEGLAHGAGFVLFIEDGYIHTLEGFSYDEPWPDTIGDFTLSRSEGTSDPAAP